MSQVHPVTLVAFAVWTSAVGLAVLGSGLSAEAGILPHLWANLGMLAGLLHVALVLAGVWFLPETWPRLVLRLIQLVGMTGGF